MHRELMQNSFPSWSLPVHFSVLLQFLIKFRFEHILLPQVKKTRRVLTPTDISEGHIASIFSVEEYAKQETYVKAIKLHPEDEGSMILRKVR
jgi:hypothetical protein